jgi:hypothetical protein
MAVLVPHSFCPVLCCCCSYLLQFSPPACLRKALGTLFVHNDRTVVFTPFCTSNVMRSVRSQLRTSHLLLSSEISRPSCARVSARSLMGSPRCDFTLIRKVALPARPRCVSRQSISRGMSASGAVAGFAFPPCPTHFLIALNLQHPDPIVPSLHDPSTQKNAP